MTKWKLDPAHSEVKFKARHLLVATVTGEFTRFNGTVETRDGDFKNADIYFEADIDSVNTRNEQRDAHLKTADFFDTEKFPKLTFKSKSIKKTSEGEYNVTGDLTIRGVTKEVTVKADHSGVSSGFGGVTVAGFEISGKVNRFDFGLKWNKLTETGGIVVSEDIRIEVNAELVKEENGQKG